LKFHGGVDVPDLGAENLGAVERGMENLARHLRNVREVYGIPCVVALNRFPADTDEEVRRVVELVDELGVRAYPATHFADGSAGATDLAKGVLDLLEEADGSTFSFTYPDDVSLKEKAETLAHRLYGASSVTWDGRAKRRLERLESDGYGGLPVCVAKTQYSFSTDATLRGAPTGHDLHVREVRLSAGAGFVVLVCGDVMTMPGLPATPAAARIDLLDDGTIVGLS
jgi:formate--tetrahydrofolate ligase